MTKRLVNLTKNPILITVNGKELFFQPSNGDPLAPKGVKGVYAMRMVETDHPLSAKSKERVQHDPSFDGVKVRRRRAVLVDKDAFTVPYLDVDDESAKAILEGKKIEDHVGKGPIHPESGERLNGIVSMNSLEGAAEALLQQTAEQIDTLEARKKALKAEVFLLEQEAAKKSTSKPSS